MYINVYTQTVFSKRPKKNIKSSEKSTEALHELKNSHTHILRIYIYILYKCIVCTIIYTYIYIYVRELYPILFLYDHLIL